MYKQIATVVVCLVCGSAQASVGSWIEPNLGQTDPAVRAIARDGNLIMLLEPQRARVLLPRSETVVVGDDVIGKTGSLALELRMLGADAGADVVMGAARVAVSRYFRGSDPDSWLKTVNHHDSVRFEDVYPGIDLVYRLRGARIEYDFELDPGADPSRIRISLSGASDVSIDADGNLVAKTEAGDFRQRAPEIYRVADKELQPVAGAFELEGNVAGFQVDSFSEQDSLIIDPVIEFSGYLGGSLNDSGSDISRNSRGNIVVTGTTTSLDIAGAPSGYTLGVQDLYFAEIDRGTGQLLWISFVGGSGFDWADAHALDSQDNIVAVGYSDSTDFPTVNAFQNMLAGSEGSDFSWDGIVVKLSDDGAQIVFATYYGGVDLDNLDQVGFEWFRGVAIDGNDHVHVVGQTSAADFPVSTLFRGRSCMQDAINSGFFFVSDIALVEFAPDGTREFAACIGGRWRDAGRDVALGADGRVHIGGFGNSDNLPTSLDAFQGIPASTGYAPFVLKLDAARTDIEWGSYVGGSGTEFMQEIAVGQDGTVVGSGSTSSADFPVTPNALQSVINAGQGATGPGDGFVFKLSSDGTTLEYGTYFGGIGDDGALATQLDAAGRVYFAGFTDSQDLIVRNPLQTLPRPLFGSAVSLSPGDAVNDIFVLEAFDRSAVAARNGVNTFTVGLTGDRYQTLLIDDTAGSNSMAVVGGRFTSEQSGSDAAFINAFAPNTLHLYLDFALEYVLIGSFQDASRDARAATNVSVGSLGGGFNPDDVVVANFGQHNELFIDAADPSILIGRPDGNTVAVVSGSFGGAGFDDDLIFANQGQDIRLLRYLGNLAYANPVIISTQSPNVTSLAQGDIDGDSDADLVIGSNPGPLQIVRFDNSEPGPLQEIAGSSAATNALLLRDGDDDGDLDLFVGNDGADQLYLNDGSGNFTVADEFPGVVTETRVLADLCVENCEPFYGGDTGLGRYEKSGQDLFVAVIDPVSGVLEFSTYLDGGATDLMLRGLRLSDAGTVLLHGTTPGNGWPVAGGAQASPGGLQEAVFIEFDIDIDDDGVLDGSDNCLEVANPVQRDTDNDAYGNFCDPDLNNDGTVNFADLQLFKQRFFGADPDADLNGDGNVNFADLQIAKGFIFGPPGPSGLLLP